MFKVVTYFLILFVLILLALGGLGYWIYDSLNKPHTHDKTNQYIKIEKGSAPAQVIEKLAQEGILANPSAVNIYLRTVGDSSKIRAGEYDFKSPITPLEVLKELEKGEEQSVKLTFLEGWTRFEIAKRIVEKFPESSGVKNDEKTVLELMNDVSLIKDIDPNAKNLEGYLYPDTYNLPREATPKLIIKTMVERFRREWKPEYAAQAQKLGKTTAQIITIASMIETESKYVDERPIVASVIYNRLSKGMALGIDATNIYAAKLEGKWDGIFHKSDAERDSPYNSRKYAGLPPTPIASPSASSIKAALNPATTDYIFYVLNVENNDGRHNFYVTASEFEKGKAAYQAWLAQQRGKNNETNANTN